MSHCKACGCPDVAGRVYAGEEICYSCWRQLVHLMEREEGRVREQAWRDTLRRTAGLLALLLALLFPAAALAQPQPGTGFQLLPSDRVQMRTGTVCPPLYTRSGGAPVALLNPWAVLAVPETTGVGTLVAVPGAVYARNEQTGRWSGTATLAGRIYAVDAATEGQARSALSTLAWTELVARRYVPLAPDGPGCLVVGPVGTNHGTGCRGRLERLCRRGHPLTPAGGDCRVTAREYADCSYSYTAYRRIAQADAEGDPTPAPEPPPTAPCPVPWNCAPLAELPAEQRPPALPVERIQLYGARGSGPECSLFSAGWLWLWEGRAHCWAGLSCSTVAEVRARGAACWAPPAPAPAPEPTPDVRVEVGPCSAEVGGRVVTFEVEGESGSALVRERFSTVLSTGRSVEVIVPNCPEVNP